MSLFNTDRVLVPVDFSQASFEAQAQTLAFLDNPSKLHVLHVLPRLSPVEPGRMWNTIDDRSRKTHVQQAFRQRFPEPEYERVNFEVAIGEPSTAILDYAKAQNIDLIVIPSRGQRGIGRFLLGSVAGRVIRYAKCPVLVLRR